MPPKTPDAVEKSEASKTTQPKPAEKLRYMRYYEHDGALRAYANRAMLLALISIPTALIAVGLAAYVRLQPPTVIRVNVDGSVVGMSADSSGAKTVSVSQGSNTAPNEFERRAYARLFLERYLNFSPDNVSKRRMWLARFRTTRLHPFSGCYHLNQRKTIRSLLPRMGFATSIASAITRRQPTS
jgi:hypothetical protein